MLAKHRFKLFSRVAPCLLLLLAAACDSESDASSDGSDAGESQNDATESSGDETTNSDATESSGETTTESPSSGPVTDVTDVTATHTEDEDGGLPDPHAIPDAGEVQCAILASTCHGFDQGTGDQGDLCHDIGHEGDEAACAENFDECIAFCGGDAGHAEEPPGDAGHEHAEDGGHVHAGDAGHEEQASDAGATQCEELGHLCHDLDTGDAGLAHECHEVGHGGDALACAAIYDECVALCSPADAG